MWLYIYHQYCEGTLCTHTHTIDFMVFSLRIKKTENLRCDLILKLMNRYVWSISVPPPSKPKITFNRDLKTLISGDQLTMTCDVSGGNPLVSKVTFNCENLVIDANDKIVPGTYVRSSLSFTVDRYYDGLVCLCSATWSPKTIFYQDTASVSLDVRCK